MGSSRQKYLLQWMNFLEKSLKLNSLQVLPDKVTCMLTREKLEVLEEKTLILKT